MLTVISIMLIGIVAGYLLRRHRITCISRVITVLIWALLFLLGVEVGSDSRIVQGLWSLGLRAVVISALCTLGSCAAAWALWRLIRRSPAASPRRQDAEEGHGA